MPEARAVDEQGDSWLGSAVVQASLVLTVRDVPDLYRRALGHLRAEKMDEASIEGLLGTEDAPDIETCVHVIVELVLAREGLEPTDSHVGRVDPGTVPCDPSAVSAAHALPSDASGPDTLGC